jgi:DHA2 family multidrug resistance protein-like MFS transporter
LPAVSGRRAGGSELGGALGLAILGTIGTAVYRGQTAETVPADLPADAAATASDPLGGAAQVADRLPQALATDVLEPAREAFTQGLQIAATVSGVLLVTAAVIVVRLLRRAHEPHQSHEKAALPVTGATLQPCA